VTGRAPVQPRGAGDTAMTRTYVAVIVVEVVVLTALWFFQTSFSH
jgi:hypothetical protein